MRQLHCPITTFLFPEEHVTQSSQSNENASFTSLYTSYICCAVEPLLTFGMSSNDIAISPELYQHVLLKRAKAYRLHHCFHLLLIRTRESTTAPLSGR